MGTCLPTTCFPSPLLAVVLCASALLPTVKILDRNPLITPSALLLHPSATLLHDLLPSLYLSISYLQDQQGLGDTLRVARGTRGRRSSGCRRVEPYNDLLCGRSAQGILAGRRRKGWSAWCDATWCWCAGLWDDGRGDHGTDGGTEGWEEFEFGLKLVGAEGCRIPFERLELNFAIDAWEPSSSLQHRLHL